MLNEVTLEGLVARDSWTFDKDLFFRLASYRDADMHPKPDIVPGRDEPDYVNVRVPGGASTLASPQRGMRLRVHGYLQSRDYKESLQDVLRKVHKGPARAALPEIGDADKLSIGRNVVEIIAMRVVVLGSTAEPADGARKTKPEPVAPVAAAA